jgi:hypothetical protein
MTEALDMQRYARHLLLAEIGPAGQARLCSARVRVAAASDPRAAHATREYLERAGLVLQVDASGAAATVDMLPVDAAAVRALAGRAELDEAAAALAGAFAAVETIKAVLGVGTPAALPRALSLAGGAASEVPA